MSDGGWIPVDRQVVYKLKGWEVVAYLELREDLEKNKFNPEKNPMKGPREYSRVWKKSPSAVIKLFKKVGYKTGQTLADFEAKNDQKPSEHLSEHKSEQVVSIFTGTYRKPSEHKSKHSSEHILIKTDKKTDKKKQTIARERARVSSVFPDSDNRLIKWAIKNTPSLFSMKNPLTVEQAEKLTADFASRKDDLADVMMAMENKPDLKKKYKSANLTIRNWMGLRANGKFSKPNDDTSTSPTMRLLPT